MEIYGKDACAACYFRTIADFPNRKAILQLTERCNLHCVHCFVSAGAEGHEMDFGKIKKILLPKLVKGRFTKVTLTGGEPFVYDRLLDVVKLLRENGIEVAICTNGTLVKDDFVKEVKSLEKVHFNVSLDGFSDDSYHKFRGTFDPREFEFVKARIESLGEEGLLKGILVTPNTFSSVEEYVSLCEFARKCGAEYVLMNPLSQFGRGQRSAAKYAFSKEKMAELRKKTERFSDKSMEMVYIRFPNFSKKPLSACMEGFLPYVFTNGKVSVCPYLSFAAKDGTSIFKEDDFIAGDAFDEKTDLADSLDRYKLPFKKEKACAGCRITNCKRGCFAARIARGEDVFGSDSELCPLGLGEISNGSR